jgi:serine/threonine protein kinase
MYKNYEEALSSIDPQAKGKLRYRKLEKIGTGTYGVVYKAMDLNTGEIVAMKKIRVLSGNEGMSGYSMREITLLQELEHPNIIRIRDVILDLGDMRLIFDYCPFTLEYLMEVCTNTGKVCDMAYIKSMLYQLLTGIAVVHSKRMIHRDLKPCNLLISQNGKTLKIADFGLARKLSLPGHEYTVEVCTLWYRAPEILLTNGDYEKPSDVWAAGCIFGELIGLTPLFSGDSSIDQLNKIFEKTGVPGETDWPGISQIMANYTGSNYPQSVGKPVESWFQREIDEKALDLL